MPKDEIRKRGAVTEYRPDNDEVSGGRDKSVQGEATGAEKASDIAQSGTTSRGAAGRVDNLDDTDQTAERSGER